jgi:hypothetical protein
LGCTPAATGEELPTFLLVFAVPAVAALLYWWRFTQR